MGDKDEEGQGLRRMTMRRELARGKMSVMPALMIRRSALSGASIFPRSSRGRVRDLGGEEVVDTSSERRAA